MSKKMIPVTMTIAGSDSSGGAGIQADLKTFTTLGVYGTCAITCIVAEHPGKVKSIQAVKTSILKDQIDLNFEAFPIRALKTGMLFSNELIEIIYQCLKSKKKSLTLVIDPVMVATSGAKLLKNNAVQSLKEKLIPLATLITPNLDEAEILFGDTIPNLPAMREAAYQLQKNFGCAVLIKGGHLGLEIATDVLATQKNVLLFQSPYRKNIKTHGTGCTLSAAITANLAKGYSLEKAVQEGKQFITRAIDCALKFNRWNVLNHLP